MENISKQIMKRTHPKSFFIVEHFDTNPMLDLLKVQPKYYNREVVVLQIIQTYELYFLCEVVYKDFIKL